MIIIRATDGVTPRLRRVIDNLQTGRVRPALGRAVASLVRNHLIEYNSAHPNKQGFPRQNLYAQMARATSYQPTADGVVVAINHVATRLRYAGGKVRPGRNASRHSGKPTRYLTIPAVAEAYGKRAGEFGNLRFRMVDIGGVGGIGPHGISAGKVPALVEASASTVKIGKRGVKQTGFKGGRVYYWLIRSATFAANPDMLPSNEQFLDTVQETLNKLAGLDRKEADGTGV